MLKKLTIDIDPNDVLYDLFQDFDAERIDGLDCHLFMKKLETIIKGIKDHKEIQKTAYDTVHDAGLMKDNKLIREGFEFTTRSTATYSYKFDWYDKKKQEIKGLEEQAKALLKQGVEAAFIPDENGELQEVRAAIVNQGSTIVMTKVKGD